MKKSELSELIREQVRNLIKEVSVSQEAYTIHNITKCGQDAAQNFIDDNKLDGKKLADYVRQNSNTKEKYNVRDIIAGTGVGANVGFKSRFLKQFKESVIKEANELSSYKIGDEVKFSNGEIWKVAKPGVKGDKIFLAPFNAIAKKGHISLPIEFTQDELKDTVTESVLKEADMTRFYDGFIVLDGKTKKTYKFKYIKGRKNTDVENEAFAKIMKATGSPRSNFGVHGFVKKGQFDTDKTPVFTESVLKESKDVRAEVISRLADFFRVSPYSLTKFNFDGSDDIKELTKALNSTSDEGTKLYYDTAIKAVKRDLGIHESLNEDAGMVIDVAMGVAVGLMGLWALVQSAPLVGRVFGDAAEYLANKSEKKAKLALKNQRKETIAPIIAKFKNDTQLADMYQALTPYSAAAKLGSSQAGLKAQQGRVNQLTKIGKYIKSKLTPEELVYFKDISAMLRDGDLKESVITEIGVTNDNSIKQILMDFFRFKRTPRGGMLGIPLGNNNNDDIESNSTAMQGIANLVKQLKTTKEMNVVSVLQPGATDIEFTVKTDNAKYTVSLRSGAVRNSLTSDSSSFWMLLNSIKKSK